MELILERKVDGVWWEYGKYDVTNLNECNALVRAAAEFGRLNEEVRVVTYDKG